MCWSADHLSVPSGPLCRADPRRAGKWKRRHFATVYVNMSCSCFDHGVSSQLHGRPLNSSGAARPAHLPIHVGDDVALSRWLMPITVSLLLTPWQLTYRLHTTETQPSVYCFDKWRLTGTLNPCRTRRSN